MKIVIKNILLILLVLQFSGCAVLSFIDQTPQTFQETHYVKTSDNWTLTLHRYYQKNHIKYKNPVILCHGMGYNAYFWDIDNKRSFARYLAGRGYDVWSVSLRGSGRSTKTGWTAWRDLFNFRADDLQNVSLDADKISWTIDDHIHQDVPAIIAKVKEVTGASQVDWVGHSMGALIVLAYLETSARPEEIGNIAALGAGTVHLKPHNASLDFIEKKKLIIDFGLLINQKAMTKIYVLFGGAIQDPFAGLFYSKENTDPRTVSRLYNHVAENISPGVMDQFILMLREEYFLSSDGKINYAENLNTVKNPVLFVSGRVDNISDPESVRYGYRRIGSQDKTYLEMSTLHGAKADYGHNDLIIGKRAQDEVYPRIYHWLVSRSNPK